MDRQTEQDRLCDVRREVITCGITRLATSSVAALSLGERAQQERYGVDGAGHIGVGIASRRKGRFRRFFSVRGVEQDTPMFLAAKVVATGLQSTQD